MAHRESIKEFLSKVCLENVSVVDWGRGTKPILRYVKSIKGVQYFGIDKLNHVDADLVTDISKPVLLGKKYDVAFCMEVLEHVEFPEQVIRNVHANLIDGGEFYLSVPFQYPIHSPEDYWRFTDQGLRLILERGGFDVEVIEPTEDDAGWVCRARKLST